MQREDPGEGIAGGERAQFGRREAGGIEASDKGTHAGAGEAVDGDVVFFHPLQDADVGQAERASAFKSHADDRTASGCNGGQRRGIGWGGIGWTDGYLA